MGNKLRVVGALLLVAMSGCENLGRGVYEGTQTRDRTGPQDANAKPTVERQPTYDEYREGTKAR